MNLHKVASGPIVVCLLAFLRLLDILSQLDPQAMLEEDL